MIVLAEQARIALLVGHTHSSDPAVAMLHGFTNSGEFGKLAMISMLNYTDFMYRPRRPEELNTTMGGGIAYNQLPHQVEVARMISCSPVRSVRASMWKLDTRRPTEGCSSVFVDFESGVVANLVYSGYDHFDSDELHDWVSSSGRLKAPNHGSARRALESIIGSPDEARMRTERYGYGGALPSAPPTHQAHFGQIVVTYEHADVRISPDGVAVYEDRGVRNVSIDASNTGRSALLDELCACVIDKQPPFTMALSHVAL
jgi:phthalate 4,5-cis-dihydrodiol dehydrogenase